MSASRCVINEFISKSIPLAVSLSLVLAPMSLAAPGQDSKGGVAQEHATTKPKAESKVAEQGAAPSANEKAPAAKAEAPATSEESAKTATAAEKANATQTAPASATVASDENEAPKSGSVFESKEKLTGGENPELARDRAIQHWNLARVYMGQFDWDLAQTELDLALLSSPELQIAHRDQCLVSLMKLNLLRSVAEFMMTVGLGEPVPLSDEEANNLIENGMVQHYKKGLSYCRQQKWKEAAVELEWAANLAPEDCAIQRSLAFAYSNMGDFNRAEAHYKKTFELSPHDGASRADLAYFLAENGKMSEAENALEEAIKSQPKATAYHVDLGWMAEKRGDLDTASRELKVAVTLSPTHANLWQHLGRVLDQKGDKAEAKEAFRQALTLDPTLAPIQ